MKKLSKTETQHWETQERFPSYLLLCYRTYTQEKHTYNKQSYILSLQFKIIYSNAQNYLHFA